MKISDDSTEQPVFEISLLSKLLLGLIWGFAILLLVVRGVYTPYSLGYTVGSVVTGSMIPTMASYLVWILRGRKPGAGKLIMPVLLLLFLMGSISNEAKRINAAKTIAEKYESIQALKDRAKQSHSQQSAEEWNESHNELIDSTQSAFQDMARSSSGEEAQLYAIMAEFLRDSQQTMKSWQDAQVEVESERVLDFSRFKGEGEIEYNKEALTRYIEATLRYDAFVDTMPANLERRLAALGPNSELAARTLAGARSQHAKQVSVLKPLLNHHHQYGLCLLNMVKLLEASKERWIYQNEELRFDSDEDQTEFNRLVGILGIHESEIAQLSADLLEKM